MKASSNLAIFVSGLCLTAGSSVFASDAPEYVNIKTIAHGGSGCPQDTVGQLVASDRKSFTLLFDEFVVEAGPGVDANEKRKNCQISIDLEFPSGWTYSVVGFDYRGYASLDSKVDGKITSKYYFQGSALHKEFSTTLDGSMDDDYLASDTFGVDAISWSPCGDTRALNINTEIFVDNSRKKRNYGLMTVDSLDGSVKQEYRLQWQRCDDGPINPPDHGHPDLPNDGPSSVKIRAISHGGTGCPQGTVGSLVASDLTAFTLIYDQFIAEVGPTVSRRENRKYCQLTVDLDYPEGWTYTLVSLDYRGFADLEDRVKAEQKTTYYFQASTEEMTFESELNGAMSKDYHYRDFLAIDTLYAPCNQRKPLNIKTEIRLSSSDRNASGLMTVDSTDGALYHVYGLRWKKCD